MTLEQLVNLSPFALAVLLIILGSKSFWVYGREYTKLEERLAKEEKKYEDLLALVFRATSLAEVLAKTKIEKAP